MSTILLRLLLLLQALTIPAPRGYVSDFAGVLDSASIQKMTAVIEDLKAKAGGEIAVVTLSDLQGREASDVALAIGRQWGVGLKGNPGDQTRNRGVVILLVPRTADHAGAFWISTGTGSEGFVTDAAAGRVRDAVMAQLKSHDYNGAMVQATELVAQMFANEFHVALDPSSRPRARVRVVPDLDQNPLAQFAFLALALVVVLAIIGALSRGGRGTLLSWLVLAAMQSNRRNRWGGWGGGGGGGFGGFGGFGGGGGGGGFGGFGGGGGFSGGGAGGSF